MATVKKGRTSELKEANEVLEAEIAERKRAEKALKDAEEEARRAAREWEKTFDAVSDFITIHDKHYCITRANRAIADGMGLSVPDVIGKPCYELIHGTSEPWPDCPHRQAMEKKETITTEFYEPHLARYLEISCSPIFDESGEVTGTVHLVRDITERKQAEKMKDEFISLVSHELRTPMTVISGSLQTAMAEGISLEDMRELLQNAVEGAVSLTAIMENMLELSRDQAGRLQLRLEMVSIADIAKSVMNKLKTRGAHQKFLADFPDDLPPVEADPMRVERILYNLLENAAKYSPDESEIKVLARKEQDFIVTGVADKGKGISLDDRGRLFELFERLEGGASPAYP